MVSPKLRRAIFAPPSIVFAFAWLRAAPAEIHANVFESRRRNHVQVLFMACNEMYVNTNSRRQYRLWYLASATDKRKQAHQEPLEFHSGILILDLRLLMGIHFFAPPLLTLRG
jgi:hypothetical protein